MKAKNVAAISRLAIYPVKSLDAQAVGHADVLPSGALARDRTYYLVEADGTIVNGKRHAAIHRLRSNVDVSDRSITLRDESDRGLPMRTFDIHGEREPLLAWLGAFFGFDVEMKEDHATGCPDDLDSLGPTVISEATLIETARWFDLPVENVRARFRANIEIDGVPPFWEDRLFAAEGTTVDFTIGDMRFAGVNPCLRCVVPTRDPWTGAVDADFVRRFNAQRRATLPEWSNRARFDRFFRLAVNTRIAEGQAGGAIRVGDAVALA